MTEEPRNRLRIRAWLERAYRFLNADIWKPQEAARKGNQRLYALLRIITIFAQGIVRNRIVTQAASLSFYTLIGIGPVLALAVMISGFVFQEADTDAVTRGIDRVIQFVAPPAAEFERMQARNGSENGETETLDGIREINPELVNVITQIIESSRSGTVGIAGIALLLLICIQLMTTIENSFNSIWGIRKGRSLGQRIVLYWSLITLGAVAAFTFLSVQVASTAEAMLDNIPFIGDTLFDLGLKASPLLSFLLVALLLALFFRFIPNTQVSLVPALVGGLVVCILLYLNNYLSFLYIQRVVINQSLYGSIGIIPLLMLGLFVFWLFILLGGQITYAVQNVRVLTSQNAWINSSNYSQETVSLAALIVIARQFEDCRNGPTIADLAERFKAPGQILNICLNRLEEMGYISSIEHRENQEGRRYRYQPARPLRNVDIEEFRREFSRFGNNQGADLIEEQDPLLQWYHRSRDDEDSPTDLESLLRRFPEEKGKEREPAAAPSG